MFFSGHKNKTQSFISLVSQCSFSELVVFSFQFINLYYLCSSYEKRKASEKHRRKTVCTGRIYRNVRRENVPNRKRKALKSDMKYIKNIYIYMINLKGLLEALKLKCKN